MSRKKKELPEIRNVEITGVAAEGNAIARLKLKESDPDPIVIFVPFGAPGDIVNIKIDRRKHSFCEGHITQILFPSPVRLEPPCEYFGICGGCRWQHLPYPEQLKYKRQQVVDALTRIGKIELPHIKETLGSKKIWHYRNKMEYTFSNRRWKSWAEMRGEVPQDDATDALGFHIPGSFDKVLQIDQCLLQEGIGDRMRNYLYNLAREKRYSFYDIKENKGLLRTLMIRIAESGQIMVCLSFGENDNELIFEILESIKNEFPEITSLQYVVNLKLNDSIADQEVINYKGPGYIEETMGNLKFRISAKSFYQTNSLQAHALYKTAATFAGLVKNEDSKEKPIVYDLYTGTGTIANFVAGSAKKVIGIEYVEDAVEDAKINSKINGIDNTEFYAGDMKDLLTEQFLEHHGKPQVMIIDPPRAGMHADVVDVILKSDTPVIVYVSCNPATQARDLSLLDRKYKVTDVQPVDMFPHTHHVENVVRLELRSNN
ncbi:MAG: 23S rRNA (uracil(1939)-C(5))-methyltransferase RlmD [Muribaculaceae bacterium]|nr:23S rRNA (uracil(1939)-C(5))-methyltransferase RlmD [Muribaculaceae bacterium]